MLFPIEMKILNPPPQGELLNFKEEFWKIKRKKK
jgi:hypothetical protein